MKKATNKSEADVLLNETVGKINERRISGCLEKSIRNAFWRSVLIYSIKKPKRAIKWKNSRISYGQLFKHYDYMPKKKE